MAAALILDPKVKGITGTLEKLGVYGAGMFGLVVLGSILLVRPYRFFQEVIMNETIKLYERVERRWRPESHRLRADKANERAEATEEENKVLRREIAELRRQLEERGARRPRRRRNNPPTEPSPSGTGRPPPEHSLLPE